MGLQLSDLRVRRVLAGLTLGVSALTLAGCMSSPTYGTDKTANMQLMEDVSNMMKVGDKRSEPIEYAPRPELVKPGEQVALVAPQEGLATEGNAAWPESPEARRARLRAEATAGQDDPTYRSPIISDTVGSSEKKSRKITLGESPSGTSYENDPTAEDAELASLKAKQAFSEQNGTASTRKYLSEPPVVYRAPEATAPVGDRGEDEWKKERRNKRTASKRRGLKDMLPW